VLGPEHPETLTAMGTLAIYYSKAGRQDEAIQLYEVMLPLIRKLLGPEHRHTLGTMHNLANSYHAAGRQDEAVQLRTEVLALRPDDSGAHNDAAWKLAISPDKDGHYPHAKQAVTWARRANELAPDNPGHLNTLGVALYRAQQWQEAIDALQKSIEHGADVPHNWLFIAMAHWQLDQKDKAKPWYDKSLAWQTANAAEAKTDPELQGFFAEAAKLTAPAGDADKATTEPAAESPEEPSSKADADNTGPEKTEPPASKPDEPVKQNEQTPAQ
jgi:tetratricopeptide (TPR) repeat protein